MTYNTCYSSWRGKPTRNKLKHQNSRMLSLLYYYSNLVSKRQQKMDKIYDKDQLLIFSLNFYLPRSENICITR